MSDTLTPAEREELEQLRREKKMREKGGLSLKVSQKGAVSLYGLGRWPVTLYMEQWEKVLAYAEEIRQFIEANKSLLSTREKNND